MRLSSWYELLLRAFPRHYRRVRGEEMLSTLLEGARSGQTRPSIRDTLVIVGAGLRCRLRLRRGPATLVAAILAAAGGAVLAATAATWAGWMLTAPPLPTRAEADAIAASLVASEPVRKHYYDFVFGNTGYDAGSPGFIEYEYHEMVVRTAEVPRLPGLRVRLGNSTLVIDRETPPIVPWLTGLVALIGAYLGWMLAARASRLVARRRPAVVAITTVLVSSAFLALLPMCLYAVTQFILGVEHGAPWIALHWAPTRDLTIAGLLCAVVAIALTESGRPNPRSSGQRRKIRTE